MRLAELFFDETCGPFCIVQYVLEAESALQFAARFALMAALGLPMFTIGAVIWVCWLVLK